MKKPTTMQLTIALGVILALMAGSKMMKAFNPQPDPPGVWGMIGVTPSDTMRLNVVNMTFAGFPPDPCNVTLKFVNSNGAVLKQQTLTIKSTQAAFLDLTGVEAGGGFRTQVHPVLSMPASEPTGCSAIGSVEVFNTASGETNFVAHPLFITLPAPAAQAQP